MEVYFINSFGSGDRVEQNLPIDAQIDGHPLLGSDKFHKVGCGAQAAAAEISICPTNMCAGRPNYSIGMFSNCRSVREVLFESPHGHYEPMMARL